MAPDFEDDEDGDWDEDEETEEDDLAPGEGLARAHAAIEAAMVALAAVENERSAAERLEAEIAGAKTTWDDRPALRQLYSFLLAKYLELLPHLNKGFDPFERALFEAFRGEAGFLAATFLWRKNKKKYLPPPITATPEQKVEAMWSWVNFVLFQIYQLKFKVVLTGSMTTLEDVTLLHRMATTARTEAKVMLRTSG